MVEQLRTQEKQKGFTGNPLKIRPHDVQREDKPKKVTCVQSPSEDSNIRQTWRNFTEATNCGMTKSEYLNSECSLSGHSQDAFHVSFNDAIAREVDRISHNKKDLTGVIECYRKVCKGNIDTLQCLLPNRRPATTGSSGRYTGFSVKSYRNPNRAEISPTFPPVPDRRSERVMTSGYGCKLFVPSPYFLKTFSQPRSAHPGSRQKTGTFDDANGEIVVSPAAVQSSRGMISVKRRTSPRVNSPVLLEHRQAQNLPVTSHSSTAAPGQTASQAKVREEAKNIHVPTEQSEIDLAKDLSLTGQPIILEDPGDLKDIADRRELRQRSSDKEAVTTTTQYISEREGTLTQQEETRSETDSDMTSGKDITIGLEDEKGERLPIEIDEIEDALQKEETEPKGVVKRRISITERVLKTRNSEQHLAGLTAEAESRKKELVDLLHEHAQIVSEVSQMEDGGSVTTAADKENTNFSVMQNTVINGAEQ